MYKDTFNRLPDNYSRQGQVNNEKLYKIIYDELAEVKKVFEDIKASQDIDNAMGKTLDKIGKNVGTFRRPGMLDIEFRDLIKTMIAANRSKGDIETINSIYSKLIEEYKGIREAWNDINYEHEPAAIVLMLKNVLETPDLTIVNRIKAGGVSILPEFYLEPEQPTEEEQIKGYKGKLFTGLNLSYAHILTIYPYAIKDTEIESKEYLAVANASTSKEITIYPKRSDNN